MKRTSPTICFHTVTEHAGEHRYLKHTSGEARVFEIEKENYVLVVCPQSGEAVPNSNETVFADLHAADTNGDAGITVKCKILDMHKRLGHLKYDTVDRIEDYENSGVEPIDRIRPSYITCAQGKQTKHAQSKKDSEAHFPIDRIEGVICSDLKGPMNLTNR